MKILDYKLTNLLGAVYKGGPLVFSPDGTKLYSPTGNRVVVTDLVQNTTSTTAMHLQSNITAMTLNSMLMAAVDSRNNLMLVFMPRDKIIHRMKLKDKVNCLAFSPCGLFIAVAVGSLVQVWGVKINQVNMMTLVKTVGGHYDDVTCLSWSSDSRYILTGSNDMTCHLIDLNGGKLVNYAAQREQIIGAALVKKNVMTVTRDGTLFVYGMIDHSLLCKHYFNHKVSSCVITGGLVVVGNENGTFGMYEIEENFNQKLNNFNENNSNTSHNSFSVNLIHSLSISNQFIQSVTMHNDWIAFGSIGQLLVWEWQSESYILKQQGHFHDLCGLAYSSDGLLLATGGDDGKVKVWNKQSGMCFVTFTEHSSTVSHVEFCRNDKVIISCSKDGTVRAFDLTRYRNFKTLTTAAPVQFSSLCVDPSGEIVCAGTMDSFEIFVWSLTTGKLLDILGGHSGPISCLAFHENKLASGSWDKSVKVWDIYARVAETIHLQSLVLDLAWKTDGLELAVAEMNGSISMWNPFTMAQIGCIEGCKETNSICYHDNVIVAGGNSYYISIYDGNNKVLLERMKISHEDDSKNENSNTDKIKNQNLKNHLPGTLENTFRCFKLASSPINDSFAATTSIGLCIFSTQESLIFDPIDLSINITPQAIDGYIEQGNFLSALVASFRLNEDLLIAKVWHSIDNGSIDSIVSAFPRIYLDLLLNWMAKALESTSRYEIVLSWVDSILMFHGDAVRGCKGLRSVLNGLKSLEKNVDFIVQKNLGMLNYLNKEIQ